MGYARDIGVYEFVAECSVVEIGKFANRGYDSDFNGIRAETAQIAVAVARLMAMTAPTRATGMMPVSGRVRQARPNATAK